MGAQVVDYRVSTLIVLCKDCGHDVGLYPARHRCQSVERPPLPALPAQYNNNQKGPLPGSLETGSSSMASSPSLGKWSSRVQNSKPEDENEESVYFNNFTSNLPEKNEASGKKLWGKIRQNEKWKQLSEKNEKPKQSGKLWGKLIQATQNMADKIPLREDRGAESDEDDWEGETHVSRILREHYEKKRLRLPEWLFDANVAVSKNASSSNRRNSDQISAAHQQHKQQADSPMRTPSRRRLWEQNPEDAKNVSTRERERQELRQAQPPMPPLSSENRSRYSNTRDNSEGNKNQNYENDYGRRSQPRDDDRYSSEKYNSNQHDDRSRHYSQDRDRYDTPPQRRESREQPVNYDNDHRYASALPTSQERSKSTSKPRYHEEDRNGSYDSNHAPPNSERSTRGYNHSESRSNRDDYYNTKNETRKPPYHNPSEMNRREQPIKSGDRRYGNDTNYF